MMKLNYNVTGPDRKRLVEALSALTDSKGKYLGVPSRAYQVGEYTIDKNGVLTGPDSLDLEDAIHQAGFDEDGESRAYDEPDTYESGLGGMGAVDDAFENLQLSESEERGLGKERREDPQGENRMQPDDCIDTLVIELSKESFTDANLENLQKLVESKEELIKTALGSTDLSLEITEDRIRFPWFTFSVTPEEIKAYSAFIAALAKLAKEQKRVTAKPKEIENKKYAFRCFLLRLGFIGDEYKQERKILLSKLIGSSAFKNIDTKEVE